MERSFEFQPAPADVAGLVFDFDRGVFVNFDPRFTGGMAVDLDFACQDEALGLFPGFHKAAGGEQYIESDFSHGRRGSPLIIGKGRLTCDNKNALQLP